MVWGALNHHFLKQKLPTLNPTSHHSECFSRHEPLGATPHNATAWAGEEFPPNAKLVEDVDIFWLTLSFMYLIILMFLGSVSRWRNFHQTWCINISSFNPPFWQCTYWIHRCWLQASFCWLVFLSFTVWPCIPVLGYVLLCTKEWT